MGILTKELEYTIYNKIRLSQRVELQCDNCPEIFFGIYRQFYSREKTYCTSCRQKLSSRHISSRKKNTNPTHPKYWIALGFSPEEAKKKVAYTKPKNIEYWLHKGYSEEDAKRLASEYKFLSFYRKEFWIKKGFSPEESEKISKIRVEELKERIKKNFKRSDNRLCIEHWLKKGLTADEAREKVLSVQHENHTKVDRKAQSARQKKDYMELSPERKAKRAKAIVDSLLKKYGSFLVITPIHKEYWLKRGFELEEAKKQAYLAKKTKLVSGNLYASKLEKNFKSKLYSVLSESQRSILKENKFLTISSTHKRYCPDFRIGKKIIEIFGSKVHLDDRFYGPEDVNPWKKTFAQVKSDDSERIANLNASGYEVLVLWEYDLKNNAEWCLEKTKEFLNDSN